MFTGTTGTLPNDLISRYNQVEIPFKSNNFRPTFLLTDRRCRRQARWAWCRRWRWRLRLWWCPGEWSSWDSSGHLMDNAGFMVYVLTQVTRRHTHNICSLTWHVGAGHDPRAAVEHDGEHGGEGHRGLRCVIYSVISCRKTYEQIQPWSQCFYWHHHSSKKTSICCTCLPIQLHHVLEH